MTRSKGSSGARFGLLTLLSEHRQEGGRLKWICRCDCGKQTEAYLSHLNAGRTTNCGCVRAKVTSDRNVAAAKHGMWKATEFNIWQGMIQRCHDENSPDYRRYGAQGIAVCEEWRESFQAFYDHIGPRPSLAHSVDRIKNERGYEPGNVRWATPMEQANNRRNNVAVEIEGQRVTAAQLARTHGLSGTTVAKRIRNGWRGADLVAKSLRGRRPK